jgi:hypothetical protein
MGGKKGHSLSKKESAALRKRIMQHRNRCKFKHMPGADDSESLFFRCDRFHKATKGIHPSTGMRFGGMRVTREWWKEVTTTETSDAA